MWKLSWFSLCFCRLGSRCLCPLHTWGGICQCVNYGADSTPVCATWSLQQGSHHLCDPSILLLKHTFTNIFGRWLMCRHVISVRTKAERVKQLQEPVWPATNMAVDRPSMSRGELHSHDINFTTTSTSTHTLYYTVQYYNGETHDIVWLVTLKHEIEFLWCKNISHAHQCQQCFPTRKVHCFDIILVIYYICFIQLLCLITYFYSWLPRCLTTFK